MSIKPEPREGQAAAVTPPGDEEAAAGLAGVPPPSSLKEGAHFAAVSSEVADVIPDEGPASQPPEEREYRHWCGGEV